MTTATQTLAPTPSWPRLRRWLVGPRQGWLSLLLLLIMLAATGLAIDEVLDVIEQLLRDAS